MRRIFLNWLLSCAEGIDKELEDDSARFLGFHIKHDPKN